MGMIIHASVIAQPNDRRQGPPPPPPPPREYQRGDDQRRDDRGPGPRKGERMRPEQREKIEMFKIQFITKNLELTKSEAEEFWPVHEAHKKAMQEIIKTKMNDEILLQEAILASRKKYKTLVVIKSVPFQTNKSLLIEKIALLVREKK